MSGGLKYGGLMSGGLKSYDRLIIIGFCTYSNFDIYCAASSIFKSHLCFNFI